MAMTAVAAEVIPAASQVVVSISTRPAPCAVPGPSHSRATEPESIVQAVAGAPEQPQGKEERGASHLVDGGLARFVGVQVMLRIVERLASKVVNTYSQAVATINA